jgi:hypothetical protein
MTLVPQVLPVILPDPREVADHAIAGKVTFPAVELLDIVIRQAGLAAATLPLAMSDAVFPRFLPADEVPSCELMLAFERLQKPPFVGTRAALSSRITLPGGILRTRVHLAVTLGGEIAAMSAPPKTMDFEIDVPAKRIYDEAIMLGPRFRSLRETARLGHKAATAIVRSPEPARDQPSLAGCPFLLDGAMHLACLWGQRYAGYVAYPTGFVARLVTAPIAQGQRQCILVPREVQARQFSCDLWLVDEAGYVSDAMVGLTLAPLSAGPRPPSWLVHPQAPFALHD